MFISKSRHAEVVKLLEQQMLEQAARFTSELDSRDRHIADLRKLVFVPQTEAPEALREVDATLTQNDIQPTPGEVENHLSNVREADRIFSGEWDQAGEP